MGEGNLRLAVSRGITVIIQATAAAYKAPAPIIRKAEVIIQAVRTIIHGAIIEKTALGAFWPWKERRVKPFVRRTKEEIELDVKRKIAEKLNPELKVPTIPSIIDFRTLPFRVISMPSAVSHYHGAAEEGFYIPTPGDPYAYKLTNVMLKLSLIPDETRRKIIQEPDGMSVYGVEASQDVFRALTLISDRFPLAKQSLAPRLDSKVS